VRTSDCDAGLARFVVWIRDGKPNNRATDDARELERIDDERECVARDSGAINLLGTSLDALMIPDDPTIVAERADDCRIARIQLSGRFDGSVGSRWHPFGPTDSCDVPLASIFSSVRHLARTTETFE